MTTPGSLLVAGIDPGARNTGIVLRRGQQCLHHALITAKGKPDPLLHTSQGYLIQIDQALTELQKVAQILQPELDAWACEGLRRPSWRLGKNRKGTGKTTVCPTCRQDKQPEGAAANPSSVMGTAAVVGRVLATVPHALLVEPGHHGDLPLGAYPDQLIGPRERNHGPLHIGTGDHKHLRSAWDIAWAGALATCTRKVAVQ